MCVGWILLVYLNLWEIELVLGSKNIVKLFLLEMKLIEVYVNRLYDGK